MARLIFVIACSVCGVARSPRITARLDRIFARQNCITARSASENAHSGHIIARSWGKSARSASLEYVCISLTCVLLKNDSIKPRGQSICCFVIEWLGSYPESLSLSIDVIQHIMKCVKVIMINNWLLGSFECYLDGLREIFDVGYAGCFIL